jgi:hypothetical protein
VRKGRFFSVPERPQDVEDLRRRGRGLDDSTRPAWLEPADDGEYLHLGGTAVEAVTVADRDRLAAEVKALEAVGLVVSSDVEDPNKCQLYIAARPEYPIWSIGMYAGPTPRRLGPAPGAENPVLTRDDVSDLVAAFVADPFMTRVAGVWYLFFEAFNWRANKGEIALATSTDGVSWTYQQRVLAEDFHVSYPHLIRDGSTFFMVPETRQSGAVRLYRARDFPSSWELETLLLEGEDVFDASLFVAHGRWWMLAGADGRRPSDTLRLFHADRLHGPWREHRRSPIVRDDPLRARPAGRVLVAGGATIRWAQCCHPTYGLDVRGFEITALDLETYTERPLAGNPVLYGAGRGWNGGGMHHLDVHRLASGGWLASVDGWEASFAGER